MRSPVFQSTPPRGGRQFCTEFSILAAIVSIHAPARGATAMRWPSCATPSLFQSTPPRGGRPGSMRHVRPYRVFQSTPPRGGRHAFTPRMLTEGVFQSTPPRGGRPQTDEEAAQAACVSIHAPARGATKTPAYCGTASSVSIHAPARGATESHDARSVVHRCFNPRPREGGDSRAPSTTMRSLMFQSTPPRGGRRSGPQ